MIWEECRRAFKEQRPVRVDVNGQKIDCVWLAEIGYKNVNGQIMRFAAGLDKNKDCLYFGKPEDFEEIE